MKTKNYDCYLLTWSLHQIVLHNEISLYEIEVYGSPYWKKYKTSKDVIMDLWRFFDIVGIKYTCTFEDGTYSFYINWSTVVHCDFLNLDEDIKYNYGILSLYLFLIRDAHVTHSFINQLLGKELSPLQFSELRNSFTNIVQLTLKKSGNEYFIENFKEEEE